MMKTRFVIFLACCIFSCQDTGKQQVPTHLIDTGPFSIEVPKQWIFNNPADQEDSFVGYIEGKDLLLSFDCSDMGYANGLLNTVNEYLASLSWYHGEAGFLQLETKTSTRRPNSAERKKYPNADFIGEIVNRGSVVYLPIKIPFEISSSNIKVDSDAHYVYRTIWPKTPGKGMTGIYIHSRKSSFNFQMNGIDLSAQNQQLALQAFKTIKFKK